MHKRNIVILGMLLATLLPGCSSDLAAIAVGTGAMPVYERPTYDSPMQTIYRIDGKRYFTITNYLDCSKRGDVTYTDERTGVKTLITALGIWPGQYRIEPSNTHVALPTFGCSDKGCYLIIEYSTDGGRKFERFHSWTFGIYPKLDEVKQTEVVVKGNHIYVRGPVQRWISAYSFDAGMRWDDVQAGYKHIEDLSALPHVMTPSKQDRFTCDTSVKPKNVSKEE